MSGGKATRSAEETRTDAAESPEDEASRDGHVHGHAHDESCPKCWAALSTPLFCESCKAMLDTEDSTSPFEALGVPKAYPLDRMALRKRLLSLSRQLHPDFHVNADDATRELAERNTAELNAAFEILEDDFHRADWLVKSLGGPSENDERQMPPEFLAEVLEWNEVIEEARDGGADTDQLESLRKTLLAERDTAMHDVSEGLTPLPHTGAPELRDVRRRLNTVRYLDRTLGQIKELLLVRQSSKR